MRPKELVAVALVGMACSTADAQDIRPDATLPELLRHAAQFSPGLQAIRHRRAAALESAEAAAALPDPRVEVAWAAVPVETRVGPQHGRLTLAQNFPWSGKRPARSDAARAEAETADREHAAARTRLDLAVVSAYLDLWFLERSIEVTRDNRDLLVLLEQVIRGGYEAGTASYAGLLRAQVEIGTLENDLLGLTDRLRPAQARLNALLHRDPAAPLPRPRLDEADFPVPPDPGALDLSASPDLRLIDARIDRAEQDVRVADTETRPDWTISLSYLPTGEALDPAMPDSGKDPVILGVGVSIPLWGKKNRAARQRSVALREAAVLEHAAAEDGLRDRIESVMYDVRTADRETRLYRNTLLPKAEQALDATLTGFRAGANDALDVVEAWQVLLRFRLSLERARAERARNVAESRALLGRDVLPVTPEEEGEETS